MVFTLYNLPAIFALIIGGWLIDKYGIKIMQMIYLSIAIMGMTLSAVAISKQDFSLLLGGRVLSGLTSECVYIGTAYYVSRWF